MQESYQPACPTILIYHLSCSQDSNEDIIIINNFWNSKWHPRFLIIEVNTVEKRCTVLYRSCFKEFCSIHYVIKLLFFTSPFSANFSCSIWYIFTAGTVTDDIIGYKWFTKRKAFYWAHIILYDHSWRYYMHRLIVFSGGRLRSIQ